MTGGGGQIFSKLLTQRCDLVAPSVKILVQVLE